MTVSVVLHKGALDAKATPTFLEESATANRPRSSEMTETA
jgi:hypothetical protein